MPGVVSDEGVNGVRAEDPDDLDRASSRTSHCRSTSRLPANQNLEVKEVKVVYSL